MHTNTWNIPADAATVERTKAALEANGFAVIVAESKEAARDKALSLISEGAETMTMTSVTLDTLGITEAINESGRYVSVRKKLSAMDRKSQNAEMQKLGSAPEWAIGSVHAVTEDGRVLIASATGSQLPAYVYGSAHVIWVVGTQKLVPDMPHAFERLETYTFPLENERAQKAYGAGSSISKVLIVNKEPVGGRTTIIFIPENIGF